MSFSEVVAGVLVMLLVFFGVLFGLKELSSTPSVIAVKEEVLEASVVGVVCGTVEKFQFLPSSDAMASGAAITFREPPSDAYHHFSEVVFVFVGPFSGDDVVPRGTFKFTSLQGGGTEVRKLQSCAGLALK